MKQLTIAAKTAQAIRKELKLKFPNIKFKVRSSNFSMGNSVDIYYTDGPEREKVEAVTSKYQYGHFNGMEDIYEYSNKNSNIPQAKFVHVSRKFSEEGKKEIVNFINKKYSNLTIELRETAWGLEVKDEYNKDFDRFTSHIFYKYASEYNFKEKTKNPEREELEKLRAWKKKQAA